MDQRRLTQVSFALLAGLVALTAWRMSAFVHDDGFITLRYARNLVETGILSWNAGEAPVEGFTSIGHLLSSAGGIALGLDPVAAVRLVNLAGALACVVAMALILRELRLPSGAQVAGFATLMSPPLIAWIWGGLEAPLVAGLIALGLLGSVRALRAERGLGPALFASFAFGLAYLTRPEAALANFVAGLALLAFAQVPLSERLKRFVALGAVSLAIVAAHLAWRQANYGEWVPLTYHAKVGLGTLPRVGNGLAYLGDALLAVPLVSVAILLAIATRARAPAARLALVVLAVQALVLVWLGGDHMTYARMLVPMLPAAAVVMATSVAALPKARIPQMGLFAVLLLAVSAFLTPPAEPDPAARVGSAIGTHLNARYPEPMTIALSNAGTTPYYAPHHTYVDMLGLNDPVIAKREDVPLRAKWQEVPGHGKGDGAYVLSRKPEFIIVGPAEGTSLAHAGDWFLTGVELSEMPEFAGCYTEAVETIDAAALPVWSAATFDRLLVFTYYRRVCD